MARISPDYIRAAGSAGLTGARESSGATGFSPGFSAGAEGYDAEGKLGSAALFSGMGALATAPVVMNNPQYADQWMGLAKVATGLGQASQGYTTAKDVNALLQPGDVGTETWGSLFDLGQLFEAGVDTAGYFSTLFVPKVINDMTESAENPHGTVPLISGFEKSTEDVGNWISKNVPGVEELSNVGRFLHRNVVGPVMETAVGQTFLDLAKIPMGIVEGTAGVLGAGYKELDEALKGYLPGGTTPKEVAAGKETDFTKEAALALKTGFVEPIINFGEGVTSEADKDLVNMPIDNDAVNTSDLIGEPPPTDAEALQGVMDTVDKSLGITEPLDLADLTEPVPPEMKLPDVVDGELVPALSEEAKEVWETHKQFSPEWWANTATVELAPDTTASYNVPTYQIRGADGSLTQIHDLPVFWDWLDAKRATLGEGGFKKWVAGVYGVDSWTKTPYLRSWDYNNPTYYIRKYGAKYGFKVSQWRPQVKAFYDEMVAEGKLALEEPKAAAGSDVAGRAADISAGIQRNINQADLINRAMNLPKPEVPYVPGGPSVPQVSSLPY